MNYCKANVNINLLLISLSIKQQSVHTCEESRLFVYLHTRLMLLYEVGSLACGLCLPLLRFAVSMGLEKGG